MQVLTGSKQIMGARLLTLRAGLKLECLGMAKHGRSCYAIIKEEFGLTGPKTTVLAKFTALLCERGILA